MPIDIEKREKQARGMQGQMTYPGFTNGLSNDELLLVAEIVRDNRTKKARWEAFENSNLHKKSGFGRNLFYKDIEPAVRKYVEASKSINLRGELVRWAVAISFFDKLEYTNLEEFDGCIDEYIKIQKESSLSYKRASAQPSWENNPNPFYWAETIGKIIGFGIVIVPVALIGFFIFSLFSGNDGRQQTQTLDLAGRVDRCVEGLRIEESCRADPEFTYCSLTEENILGSGCTSRVRTAANPANFCIAAVRPAVRRTCMIQIAGCAAVTGNPNDPSCR